ncbi:hypothetical protein Dimus_013968 [Dionaea muscipula]
MHIDACKEFYVNLTMFHYKKKEVARSRLKRENGIWWLGTGDHRRRDDDVEEGELRSGEKFYDVEDEVQESAEVSEDVPDMPAPAPVQQKEKEPTGVDPSAPTGSIPDSVFVSLQAEFERAGQIGFKLIWKKFKLRMQDS